MAVTGLPLQSTGELVLRLMIPVTFAIIGLALVAIGGRKVFAVKRAVSRSVETEGTVLSARLDEGPDRTDRTYAPRVTYEYEYEDEEYSGGDVHPGGTWATGNKARMREMVDEYRDKTGETVPVYVDPKKPERSYLREGILWHAYLAIAVGLLTLAAGTALILSVVG